VQGGDSALEVIDAIESLPRTFKSKSDFIEALVAWANRARLRNGSRGPWSGKRSRALFSISTRSGLILDYFLT